MSPEERLETLPFAEVIGDPIAQSKSPLIHNFWLAKSGVEATYQRHHVRTDGLEHYLATRRMHPNWRGCNVTMPHKQAIIPMLDRLDPLAERIGAVNTVVRDEDGLLSGYNTDCSGFLEPLRGALAQPSLFRMARIIGTGGAARAIVAGLADKGFTLVLAGRDLAKAQALLHELAPGREHHAVVLDHFADATDFAFDDRKGILDLVVNASPLGMRGNPPLAFDWSHAPPGAIAYDIVTDPVSTPLLETAARAGLATIDGLAMLVGQAAQAFELIFGVSPPREHDSELRERLLA